VPRWRLAPRPEDVPRWRLAPRPRSTAVALGLVLGLATDTFVADPRRAHPVAGFGRAAALLERGTWRPSRRAGVLHVVALVVPLTCAGAWLDRRLRRHPWARGGLTAVTSWAVLGSASLAREASALAVELDRTDLPAARLRLPALCGRDPQLLDAAGLARAAVESVAENTADAAVAPLVWGALAGTAGLVGYRAVNTLDAMVGHRSERYLAFGWAAARLDDLLTLLPARLTAVLAVAFAPAVGGSSARAWRVWRRDAGAHPSPNAGPCEAAFAGALGNRLGGPTVYPYGCSQRPWLGEGGDPGPADVRRAVRLSRLVTLGAVGLTTGARLAARPR